MAGDWQEFRDRTFENDFSIMSWKSWLMFGTGIVAIVAFVFSVTLSYRIRALSSSIALMPMMPKTHAFVTVSVGPDLTHRWFCSDATRQDLSLVVCISLYLNRT